MFIKNAWYVAATAAEVQDKPLGRTICGEPMVFYRGEASPTAHREAETAKAHRG